MLGLHLTLILYLLEKKTLAINTNSNNVSSILGIITIRK